MKIVSSHRVGHREQGYALVLVAVFSAISILMLTGALNWTSSNSRLNARNNEFQTCLAAAEAATEKALATIIKDYKEDGEGKVYAELANYRLLVPNASESAFWSNYEFSDGQGNTGKIYVERVKNEEYVTLDSKYKGLQGWASTYRIIANAARKNSNFNSVGAVMQEVQIASIPIFQFAIFYEPLMEFTWAAPLNVRGRVHGNDSIYTGSSAPLVFHEDVTSVGINQSVPWWGFSSAYFTGSLNYLGQKDTNTATLNLPIGTNNTPTAVKKVIEMPPAGEPISSAMGMERYYNKSEMAIIIGPTGSVDARVKVPYTSTYTTVPYSEISSWLYGDSLYDQREDKTAVLAEIDVAKFNTWTSTNNTVQAVFGPGKPINLLYIDDQRNTSSSQFTAIRLVNGKELPARGLTLATPDPLYVKGHFNQPNNAHLGTPDTSATKPASLVSDALTILSDAWNDGQSSGNFKYRDAVNTTVNAAILTGTVPSAGYQGMYPRSGGVMNLPRLLEDWGNGSRRLTINGSIVNLWYSTDAKGPFEWPGNYYYAPTRDFNFDTNFKDVSKLPPGTPQLRVLIRGKWRMPAPNQIAVGW